MKQEIHFVTGKGGVGKSVIAAALAQKKVKEGRKVLLVELGDQSFYRDFFGLPPVGFQPQQIHEGLSLALWSGDSCLQEYAKHLIKVESLVKIFFQNSVMKTFVSVAPGLSELAILGKATSGPRKHGPILPYDCLILDTYATGHFLALLRAPKGMSEAIQYGPMGEQSREIDKVLRNPELCKFHIVSLPEELPVQESRELAAALENEFSIKSHLILNKIVQSPVGDETLKTASSSNSDLGRFAHYLLEQRKHQSDLIAKSKKFAPDLIQVPLIFESDPWVLVNAVAEALR